MNETVHSLVLGGTGYVGAELIRLLAGHPRLELAAVISDSQAGNAVADVFPHLTGACAGLAMEGYDALPRLFGEHDRLAVFAAAPHRVAAERLDYVLETAERSGARLHIADTSADFRFRSAEDYARVYDHAHGAPQRLEQFACAVPEHLAELPDRHYAHPGCFSTAVLLALVPLLRSRLIAGQVFVSAITGSTGSGRSLSETTHHPFRHANLFAYKPLAHRHAPEIVELAEAASDVRPALAFVPHSGPFARGIHATLQAALARSVPTDELIAIYRDAYDASPFISVGASPPRLKDVVGSNRCHLGIALGADSVVVFSVLDNLLKGAAGGAVQWMNRRLGFAETAGLAAPAIGWS